MIDAIVRKRKLFVAFAVFCVTMVGQQVYVSLPREANPEVEIPVVTVTTPYIGVSPADVETLVTIPLENELAGVKDLKQITSTSYEGMSMVILEFEPEVNIQDATQRVRDRVSRAQPKLPDDAEEPNVAEISFTDLPILIVALGGPVDEIELKRIGENLEDEIRRIPGVLDANLTGGREREIRIEVDPVRLSHYGLSLNDVSQAIATENVNIPGGNITSGDSTFLLRVPGEFESAEEIADVAVKRVGDRPVFVRDIATVVDDFAPRATYSRMNGHTSVSIAVSKRTGANIVELVDAIQNLVGEHSERWPEGVSAAYLGDQSEMVDDMVSELENGIITGLLLVIAVLLFFMGVRNSFFVAIAIPLSMLLAFLVVGAFGMTLNMIVLFSLIMALGMLVDNAIVIVENIFRHVEEGSDLLTASVDGTREVAGAVAASTATTVAAFAPLLFWTGIMGQFMGYLPRTIVITLICSLIVAVVVLPVATARFMRRTKAAKEKAEARESTEVGDAPYRDSELDAAPLPDGLVMSRYRRLLELAIRRRYWTFALGNLALIGTFMAYGALNNGVEFFPETEPNRATISVRAPIGTDVEATDRIVRQIENFLTGEENVDVFVAEVGVSGGGQDPMAASQAAANLARITVDFLPDQNTAEPGEQIRIEDTTVTIERIREAVESIPGAEIVVEKERMGPPVGKPVDVRVIGDDIHEAGRIAARVRRELREIPGVTGLSDNYRVGRPELRLRIDRGAAKRVGASTQAVAGIVRAAVNGQEVSTLRDGEDEYDIIVTLAEEHREDLQSVLSLRIDGREDTSPDTFPVPISAVASYELAGGTGALHHIDQQLAISITGDVSEGFQQDAVQRAVLEYIDEREMPPGYHLELGGSNDEQEETAEFLGNAMLVALLLILCVLVFQFNALLTPLIVLYSVVLSLIGVLWGLIITGMPFGVMMTGLGVISLAGIVVNNAIVLLDYVRQLEDRGAALTDALVRAGMTRFRPVVLTAITTVLGLVPMAIGVSVDFRELKLIVGSSSAAFWGPMAVAIIFGLAAATILTLVLIPSFYAIIQDIRGLVAKVRGTSEPASAE